MPNPNVDDLSPDPIDALLRESTESLATMERDAQAIFDARRAPLNSVSDAISAAERAPKSAPQPVPQPKTPPKAPPAAEVAPSQAAAKVQGPPQGVPGVERAEIAPPADDFADVKDADAFSRKEVKTDDWKRLHAKAEHFATQTKALQQEITQLRTATGSPVMPPEMKAQLEQLQKERDLLQARLETVAVEKSPRFEAAFKPRLEAAIQQAKASVGPERAQRVQELLNMPESAWRDEQLDAMVQDIGSNTLRASKLVQAVAQIDSLTAEKAQLAARGSELFKSWNAEEQAARDRDVQQRTTEASTTFDRELKTWQNAMPLTESDVILARDVFSGKREWSDIANAALWAVAGPKIAQDGVAAKQRIAELETEITRLRGAQPNLAPNASSNGVPSEDEIPEGTGYGEAIARMAMKQGLLRR